MQTRQFKVVLAGGLRPYTGMTPITILASRPVASICCDPSGWGDSYVPRSRGRLAHPAHGQNIGGHVPSVPLGSTPVQPSADRYHDFMSPIADELSCTVRPTTPATVRLLADLLANYMLDRRAFQFCTTTMKKSFSELTLAIVRSVLNQTNSSESSTQVK
jgi:hypothetical protein